MGVSWSNEGKKKRNRELTLCLVQKTCPAPPSGLEPAGRQAQCCVGVNSGDTDTPTHTHTNADTHLVFHGDFGAQRVVRVPLLAEAQAQLLHLVLGLQAARGLARVCVTGAGCVELLCVEGGAAV